MWHDVSDAPYYFSHEEKEVPHEYLTEASYVWFYQDP
jgi:hypothetical protein